MGCDVKGVKMETRLPLRDTLARNIHLPSRDYPLKLWTPGAFEAQGLTEDAAQAAADIFNDCEGCKDRWAEVRIAVCGSVC